MKEVLKIYNIGRFTATEIHCDNESYKTMDDFTGAQHPTIKMDYITVQEHIPKAEQYKRVIKEHVRATYHRLPFTHLPLLLVKYVVLESTTKVNCVPNKHGVSKHYSP